MTDRAGRHAAERDRTDGLPEAELRLAEAGRGAGEYRGRPNGRHAAPGRDLASHPAGNGQGGPQNGNGQGGAADREPAPAAMRGRRRPRRPDRRGPPRARPAGSG